MKKNINELLSQVNYKDIASLSKYIYEHYLKVTEEQDKLIDNFTAYLKWGFITSKTFDIGEFDNDYDYKKECDKAGGILNPNIENLINNEVEESDFYANIWETFSNSALFATDNDKIGALVFLKDCNIIPYFKLDQPFQVTEEEFNETFDMVSEDIQKCMFICNRGYEYRTDVASQLLRLIENHKDEKTRVVLFARILHYLQWLFENEEDEEGKQEGQSGE